MVFASSHPLQLLPERVPYGRLQLGKVETEPQLLGPVRQDPSTRQHLSRELSQHQPQCEAWRGEERRTPEYAAQGSGELPLVYRLGSGGRSRPRQSVAPGAQ